uniref:Uncharacterized protein n=1 Tax=Arundo donax TaxID=35708 RepID=A0A0A9AHT9_ARUDO
MYVLLVVGHHSYCKL